jgi:hypothetical protein
LTAELPLDAGGDQLTCAAFVSALARTDRGAVGRGDDAAASLAGNDTATISATSVALANSP